MLDNANEAVVAGLTSDSRKVQQGFLFAAITGAEDDGRRYIKDAIDAGAVAILTLTGTSIDSFNSNVIVITDPNPRYRFARMAAKFYKLQPSTIVAVTGTNGKTSVVHFAQQIWNTLGYNAAALGTLGVIGPDIKHNFNLTTPEPVDLHQTLAELHNLGVEYLACEASSHGLSQYRLDGLKLSAAAFTNLSLDHLDYHDTMESYREAKFRLFNELIPDGSAIVVNADTKEYAAIKNIAEYKKLNCLTYGFKSGDLRCISTVPGDHDFYAKLNVFGSEYEVDFPLYGHFQLENALCAAGLVIACGEDPKLAIPLLSQLQGVPGRMQQAAQLDNGARIFIDYAHTPDALKTAIQTLRRHVRCRLVVLFGCGGSRDKEKRPKMGKIAADLADAIIITDDNPRNENPATIRRDILKACGSAQEIGDRATAICAGVAMLNADDVLLIAGKGHETEQTTKQNILPFNDLEAVRQVVCLRQEQSA